MQKFKERVHLGALIDRDQHERVHELARVQDRSVSSVIRQALACELHREGLRKQTIRKTVSVLVVRTLPSAPPAKLLPMATRAVFMALQPKLAARPVHTAVLPRQAKTSD